MGTLHAYIIGDERTLLVCHCILCAYCKVVWSCHNVTAASCCCCTLLLRSLAVAGCRLLLQAVAGCRLLRAGCCRLKVAAGWLLQVAGCCCRLFCSCWLLYACFSTLVFCPFIFLSYSKLILLKKQLKE